MKEEAGKQQKRVSRSKKGGESEGHLLEPKGVVFLSKKVAAGKEIMSKLDQVTASDLSFIPSRQIHYPNPQWSWVDFAWGRPARKEVLEKGAMTTMPSFMREGEEEEEEEEKLRGRINLDWPWNSVVENAFESLEGDSTFLQAQAMKRPSPTLFTVCSKPVLFYLS